MSWEIAVLNYIQSLRTPFWDVFFSYFTALCELGIICWCFAIVLLSNDKARKEGLAVLAACLLEAFFCDIVLKHAVARERPFTVTGMQLIIEAPSGYSFTSGHTGLVFSCFFALYLLPAKKKLWAPTLLFAIVMAFSRLYLYVHFPTDVLGGILLGVLCGKAGAELSSLFFRLVKKYREKKHPKKRFIS